jgi:hypothetical protein
MRNGPCPECNSTEVYYGETRGRQGGLRDEHQVYIPTGGPHLYAETYVCLSCGCVRLFLDEQGMQDAAKQVPADPGWTKVS